MASITQHSNGRKVIQYRGADGKRRSLRLGKISRRAAETIRGYVEALAAASITGHSLDDATARWVADRSPAFADKLAAVGLVPKRSAGTLEPFIREFIDSRPDVKRSTKLNFEQARDWMVRYFGAGKPLRDITPGEADSWYLWMLAEGLGENTAKRHVGRAKQLFKVALRRRVVSENPFADLKSRVGADKSRFYFVTVEDARKVLDACPDGQWRLLFALARYGGLRIPSEALALTWNDIDWEQGRISVRVPKLEHLEGHETRMVPMFPELQEYLAAEFEAAAPGTIHVITRYRESNANLRTQLNRIIVRAGLKPWGKPFQNLRSTRETELCETFPAHVVCAWIGNSESVARKHYLQVTDEHFAKAVQKAVQPLHVTTCPARPTPAKNRRKSATGSVWPRRSSQNVPPRGVEPLLPD